jgi:Ran GTPase-activating protein (RanGAP) involved in mRNA processing and transport
LYEITMKRYDWIRLSATLNQVQSNGSTKLVLEDLSFGRGTMQHLVDFLQRSVTSDRSIRICNLHYQVNALHLESCVISRERGSLSILCDYFASSLFSPPCSMTTTTTTTRLREVFITDCVLGNENAALLLGSMSSSSSSSTSLSSSLKVLRLVDVDCSGSEAGRLLGAFLIHNPQLQTLEVSSCPLGRDGIRSLRLALTSSAAATASTTSANTSTILDLRRLALSKCEIENDGLEELILLEFANTMPFLNDIELRRNNFSGEAGGRLLCQLVQNMLVGRTAAGTAHRSVARSQRESLMLSIDFGGGNPIGPAGWIALGPALRACGNRLKSLTLDDCCNGDGDGGILEALDYLRICLQHSTSLVQLNLADNGVQATRARHHRLDTIDGMLRHHGSLKTLDLSSNPLGAHGAQLLAMALRDHEAWDLLNLQLCRLGDLGVAILLEQGLAGHAHLKCINLSRNQCTGASLPSFTMLLNDTPNLEELVLFSNDIFVPNTTNHDVGDNANNNMRNFEPVKLAFLEAVANHKKLRAIDLRNTYTATTTRRNVLNDNSDPAVAIAGYLLAALQDQNTSLDTVHVDANRDQRRLIDAYAKRNLLLKQVQPLLLVASTTDRNDDGNRWCLALAQCSRHEEGTNASYKVLHKMVEHGFFQKDE